MADAVGDALGIGACRGDGLGHREVADPASLVVVLIIAILYYATPNVKQPKFRWMSIGAAVAIVVWSSPRVGFGLYVANFSNYNRTYGSFAGIIVFLLWLWIANLALLFGAELDAELERGRQLQAGIAAEEDIKLPPRDTRQERQGRREGEGGCRGGPPHPREQRGCEHRCRSERHRRQPRAPRLSWNGITRADVWSRG